MALTNYGNVLAQYEQMAKDVRTKQEARKSAIESIYSEVISRYRPGGTFGAGYEAELGKRKVQDVGRTAQRDISRGLYGIRPYEQEWESAVGAPARLKLEDIRMERLSQAQTGMAGFLERIEEPYPDYGPLMQAAQAQGGGGRVDPRLNLKKKGVGGGYGAGGSLSDWMQSTFPAFYGGGATGGGAGGGQRAPTRGTGMGPGGSGLMPIEQPKDTQKQIYADLLAGEQAGTAAKDVSGAELTQAVQDIDKPALGLQPPSWTGNYRSWKKKMDEYMKATGKPTTGY